MKVSQSSLSCRPLPGSYHARRNGQAPIAAGIGQIGVVERIISDGFRPTTHEIGTFLFELPLAPVAGWTTEARTLVVIQFGIRRPDDREACLIEPKAKIHIVESDAKIVRVEAAEPDEHLAAHHHAGCRNGRETLYTRGSAEIPRRATLQHLVRMPGESADPHDNAGMLNGSIRKIPAWR
jgi:hypothetical protein